MLKHINEKNERLSQITKVEERNGSCFMKINEEIFNDDGIIYGNINDGTGQMKEVSAPVGFTAAEMDEMNLKRTWFLIDGFLMEGLVVLAAAPNIGKTIFCSQLAYATATGGEFLGKKVKKATALYMDLENSRDETKERFDNMGLDLEGLNNLVFVNMDEGIKNIDDGFTEQLSLYKQRYPDLKLVIVDTLSKIATETFAKKDYYAETRILSGLRKAAKELKIVLLFVHHMSKLQGGNSPYAGIYGSNAFSGSSDVIIALRTTKEGKVELSAAGNRIERIKVECAMRDMTWRLVTKEESEKHLKRKLRATAEYRAVCNAYRLMSKEGILKIMPSELFEYAKGRKDVGWIDTDRKLARWIRLNRDFLQEELHVEIHEKKIEKGKQFIFSPEVDSSLELSNSDDSEVIKEPENESLDAVTILEKRKAAQQKNSGVPESSIPITPLKSDSYCKSAKCDENDQSYWNTQTDALDSMSVPQSTECPDEFKLPFDDNESFGTSLISEEAITSLETGLTDDDLPFN